MQKRENLDAINQDAFNLNLSHILTYPAVQEHFFFPLNDCPECQFSDMTCTWTSYSFSLSLNVLFSFTVLCQQMILQT